MAFQGPPARIGSVEEYAKLMADWAVKLAPFGERGAICQGEAGYMDQADTNHDGCLTWFKAYPLETAGYAESYVARQRVMRDLFLPKTSVEMDQWTAGASPRQAFEQAIGSSLGFLSSPLPRIIWGLAAALFFAAAVLGVGLFLKKSSVRGPTVGVAIAIAVYLVWKYMSAGLRSSSNLTNLVRAS